MGFFDEFTGKASAPFPYATTDQLNQKFDELDGRMQNLVQLILNAMSEPEPKRETKTYPAASFTTFEGNGYKYNTFLTADSQNNVILTVRANGYTYTVTLKPGFNTLNLLDGSEIKPSTDLNAVVILHNHELQPKEDVDLMAKEPFSGNANATHNFLTPMKSFSIANDSATVSLTFTITFLDGTTATYTVLKNESFSENFAPFQTVQVTATDNFRAYGRA